MGGREMKISTLYKNKIKKNYKKRREMNQQ